MTQPQASAQGLKVLHAVNYGWPHIDGYTVRTSALMTAQKEILGYDVTAAVSPYVPLTRSTDGAFTTPAWGPAAQRFAGPQLSCDGGPTERGFERPSIGFAPLTRGEHRSHLIRIAKDLGTELVHAHHPFYNAAAASSAAQELFLPFVYEVRCFNGDYDLDQPRLTYTHARGRFRNLLEYRMAKRADAVVTLTDKMAERLVRHGVDEAKVHVVRNSVDERRFTRRQGHRQEPGKLRVGYATTFEKIENLDTAVRAAGDAAAILAEAGVSLTLKIAGGGRDWTRIEGIVRSEGLGHVVELCGLIPYSRMPEFYEGLDLFLVPRGNAAVAQDTTPLKPLEAASVGVPLAVSDLPAMRALLDDNARFFEPTRKEMADALLAFVQAPWPGPPPLAERSWSREVLRYEQVYADAMKRQSMKPSGPRRLPASAYQEARP